MLRKLSLYLLILTTCFNLAGGYAAAASLKAASFSICTFDQQTSSDSETTIKKASSDLVILARVLVKEGNEEENQNLNPDFVLGPTDLPGFLPLFRAGPAAKIAAFSSASKGNVVPLFVLNCNFRL